MAVHAGTVVMTPFGKGIVRNIRKDGGVDVHLSWQLSDDKMAVAHFPETKSLKFYPDLMTPFGKGVVMQNRKDGGVNVILDWRLANEEVVIAYLPEFLVSGTIVQTPFGTGKVSEQRQDGGVNVHLDWVLSDGKSAVAYVPDTKDIKPFLKSEHDRELKATESAACAGYCSIL